MDVFLQFQRESLRKTVKDGCKEGEQYKEKRGETEVCNVDIKGGGRLKTIRDGLRQEERSVAKVRREQRGERGRVLAVVMN